MPCARALAFVREIVKMNFMAIKCRFARKFTDMRYMKILACWDYYYERKW